MTDITRRDFTRAGLGAFIILTTPFTAAGDVDWDDLARDSPRSRRICSSAARDGQRFNGGGASCPSR